MLKQVSVSAPAKLVLTGEYAVLESDALAVVAAIDRYTEAHVTPAATMSLTAPALDLVDAPATYENGRWKLQAAHPKAAFVSEALSATLHYLEGQGTPIVPFHLTLSPALAENGIKVGLGGSAATTVAAVAALLLAFGRHHDPELVYRLGAIAHFLAQGSGSGIDVAASAFGGVLAFSSHHPDWLERRLAEEPSLSAVIDGEWPHLRHQPLPWPASWNLMVGWTGNSASTPAYLQLVAHLKADEDPRYRAFLAEMQASSLRLTNGLRTSDAPLCLQALEQGRNALLMLEQALGVSLETPELERLVEAATTCKTMGKPSGAGGGDCGIALAFDPEQAACLREAWERVGVHPLNLAIAPFGVRRTPDERPDLIPPGRSSAPPEAE